MVQYIVFNRMALIFKHLTKYFFQSYTVIYVNCGIFFLILSSKVKRSSGLFLTIPEYLSCNPNEQNAGYPLYIQQISSREHLPYPLMEKYRKSVS